MNDQAIEQEIQAKGLTAPRVTPAPTFEANLRPLQKLARRLTELLDEDQWAECEALLIAAGLTHNAEVSGAGTASAGLPG